MSTVSISRTPQFVTFSNPGWRHRPTFQRASLSPIMKTDSKPSQNAKKEELSLQHRAQQQPLVQQREKSRSTNLRFDRLQPSDRELNQDEKLEFGNFVAREALVDEELWTAAWLRAETHWEGRPGERYVDSFKRKFAEQEFNAIKRRSKAQNGQPYSCVVTVKREEKNIKRTVLKSVVGTLDFSIRHLFHGESFPRVCAKPSFCSINKTDSSRYAYVSNLCVSKSARRQGIARNMLNFAIESARSKGIDSVYVHVHTHNGPALELYQSIGFEMVEMATPQLSEQQMYLLCIKT